MKGSVMKRKNKTTEEQKVSVGDSVLYFAQTYTVVEMDVDFSSQQTVLSCDNLRIILHIKAVEYPFNSLWVKRSDVSVVTKGECNES
jgi:hypothetical protein